MIDNREKESLSVELKDEQKVEQKAEANDKAKYIKPAAFLLMMGLIFAGGKYFGWGELLTGNKVESLQLMVQENFFKASGFYIGLTILGSSLLALPGASFAVIAALAFGPFWGTILCSIATTIGATIAFFLGRYFLKSSALPMIEKHPGLKKLLLEDSGKNAMLLLMITRLVPIFPYNIQNYAYGITDIKALPFALYSMIFMLPGTAMFTYATAGLSGDGNRWINLMVAGVLVFFVFVVGRKLKSEYDKFG